MTRPRYPSDDRSKEKKAIQRAERGQEPRPSGISKSRRAVKETRLARKKQQLQKVRTPIDVVVKSISVPDPDDFSNPQSLKEYYEHR